ncbi:uncharacterized protein [Montipora foliosa]|uniref:uncharacterized protein isoform X2 n=1 Tax=Montipora foliosa TaxID=591990 RepID=UPI0035F136B9
MATPGPLASSKEKTNGSKLSRLIIDGGTTVMRNVFDIHHPPANLTADLKACYSILDQLFRRRILNGHQWDKLFPVGGAAPDSTTFDITLLFLLLTNICGLTPPHTGWHCKPPLSDTSREANLARIKFFRNQLYGHITTTGVDELMFNALWQEISAVLVSLGLSQAEVDRLKAERCGEEDYVDALRDWAESEGDLKTQLNDLRQSVEENVSNLKDLRIQQLTTQKTVEEGNFRLENLQISQNTTQQAVKESNSRIEDIHQIVSEMRETQPNTDQEENILKKLARVDTQRDVRDYTKTYLEGTRESFIAKINTWLDDKSSPNRVLVLSGNAGMGKSVIAAEMCRRMQEAGRLAGSHFCHHDSARHRNPKVMMQSLACHLSCCLPEYKKALVEQLSGNLGVEINDMEVRDLFDLLFLEPLNRVADPGFTSLVVIDALDESEYQGRNDLLDLIANLFKNLPLWLRFLVTTRPEVNIWDTLKDLQPLILEPKDEDNLKVIRFYFECSLSDLLEVEMHQLVLDDLVQKSEGVFLCAKFLVDFIRDKCSTLLTLEQLDKTLPTGIACVYQSYFQRLEHDLCKELSITQEQFLCFLGAIAAAREPLPLGFVPKLLCTNLSSSIVMRKASKAIAIVSSLLPVHEDRIHFFHKSVKDWLTDKSRYKQHSFSVEEMEGHRILSSLCCNEFDELKSTSIGNSQSFSDTSMYALEHGVQHMLQVDQDMKSCSLEKGVGKYVSDPELLYAKLCVNTPAATEDIVGVMKQGSLKTISTEFHETLSSILILLKKHGVTLQKYPFTVFQSLLNEGNSKLSSDSRQLLVTKYSDKPHMEFLNKNDSPTAIQARFVCGSQVACLDVSPSLEYMVCECRDGSIQFWSLASGNLKWKRYVKPKQYARDDGPFRITVTSDELVRGFYRSVVFHPFKDVILPGVLNTAYSFDGNLKPLFRTSNCIFSICSICGSEMLTDCPDDTKCLMMWNLNNGKEIDRLNSDKEILSFGMSQDGKLVAISHSTGSVCLVDRENGFSTLAEVASSVRFGMIRFSPGSREIYCSNRMGFVEMFGLTEMTDSIYCMDDWMKWFYFELESHRIGGFLLGDPLNVLCGPHFYSDVVLNSQSVLRNRPWGGYIELVYGNALLWKSAELLVIESVTCLRFSLTGESLYAIISVGLPSRIIAWDVSNGELKGQKKLDFGSFCDFVPLNEGILIATESTLELWNFDLSVCMRRWSFGACAVFPVSDDQVACLTYETRKWDTLCRDSAALLELPRGACKRQEGIILDTVGGDTVATFKLPNGRLIACYRDLQLFASFESGSIFIEMRQLGKTEPLWRAFKLQNDRLSSFTGSFSSKGQYIVVRDKGDAYILDAVSGNVRLEFSDVTNCKFISDEECIFLKSVHPDGGRLELFNVSCGDLLTVMDVDREYVPETFSKTFPFATCPGMGLIAICSDKQSDVKIIKVMQPEEKTLSRETKRFKLQRG